jgi:hypothetical protein
VEILGKGTLGANSMICWPTRNDLDSFFRNADDGEPYAGPTEPLQPDDHEKGRKDLRQKHRKEKIALRKRWKAVKAKLVAAKAEKLAEEKARRPGDDFDGKIRGLTAKLDALKSEREAKNAEFSGKMTALWIDDINDDDDKVSFKKN